MSPPRCFACKRPFKSTRSLKRHLSLSRCNKLWKEELRRKLPPLPAASDETFPTTYADLNVDHGHFSQLDARPLSCRTTSPERSQVQPAKRARLDNQLADREVSFAHFFESYPSQVADNLGVAKTPFQRYYEEKQELGLPPWAPFADMEEWGLVKWLINRVNKTGMDEFLKLPIVCSISSIIHLFS
jgi:hypothetical protein